MLPLARGNRSPPFPFYGQKLVAWQCVSSKRAERQSYHALRTWNIKHYLASSNNDYQHLSSGHQIFDSLSFLQVKSMYALPPPSKGEKPNTLSWSSLHPNVFGLGVTFNGLCSREWYQHPVKMWLPCIWRSATHKDKWSFSHKPKI